MSVKILLVLMFVHQCFMLDLSNHPAEKSGLLESLRKHMAKKEAGQDVTANEKKSLAIRGNHLTSRSDDDTVSQEEFDEAIATLTAMYDMLNAQMMTFGGELDTVSAAVTELQGNTVKRCETGIKSLYCTLDCCNIDFSPECTYRSSHLDMFPVQMTFAQAFDQPPVVMVTASVNFEIIVSIEFGVMNGFFHTPAQDITTTGFVMEMRFSVFSWMYYTENYTITWIACQH